ncbi:hypothetical protein [Pseudonocardia spinosispora]|uniref:hypothetical protein n=1 Tax=Pseudonocardia spinosispora TaxID=103441 RepID=UPI000428484E|nr:hypothetical protein [Pseudonocardia spinosispora]
MYFSGSRTLEITATVIGAAALGAAFSGTAVAATPGTAQGLHTFEMPTSSSAMPTRNDEYPDVPGSGTDSDIDHNYHDDTRPNSASNANQNSSLAQCGAGNENTAGRDECKEKNVYDHRYDHDYSYDGDPDGKGSSVLGSLF